MRRLVSTFSTQRRALLPAVLLILILLFSLLAPWLAPYDPLDAPTGAELQPPSPAHVLGTDLIGRVVFTRVLYGGGRTLMWRRWRWHFPCRAGWGSGRPRRPRRPGNRSVDAAGLPSLLLALTLIAIFGNGLAQVALAVGLSGMPAYARVVRAATREARSRPFVEAARSVGARPRRILFRHILPNVAGPLLAFATAVLAWAILNAATLNFLGFGGDPAAPEWGLMLAEGRQVYRVAPWTVAAPGLAIMLTLLAVNALADALSG
jgi:peptide/nickel transport system permease protein